MPVSTSRFEAAAYEIPELWEPQWFSEVERERARAHVSLLPADARTLIDVGCGNGLFLHEVAAARPSQFAMMVGVDRSNAALRHVRASRCRSSVDRLPFGSGTFDLATCMEVLEHLPDDVFRLALAELARVSSRYVLAAVPWRENLSLAKCRCPQCHADFNPDFHVRSFNEDAMAKLFHAHGLRMVWTRPLGGQRVFADQLLLSGLERRLSGPPLMPAHAICPECGFHDAGAARRELERRSAPDRGEARPAPYRPVGKRLLASLRPKVMTYRWVAALYEREPR